MKYVECVTELENEGKSYDLFYEGRFFANVTLESGVKMREIIAASIIHDILESADCLKAARSLCLELVSFKESGMEE